MSINMDDLETIIQEENLKYSEKELKRIHAILECFGTEALVKDKEVTLSNGEVIYAWALEGISEVEDLKSMDSDILRALK